MFDLRASCTRSASTAIRRGLSTRRRSGSRRRRLQLMQGHNDPAAHDDRHVQHDEPELDDCVARHSARGLGRRIQSADDDVRPSRRRSRRTGATMRSRRATTCGIRTGRSRTPGFRQAGSSSTAPTPAPRTRRDERSCAVVGAVPAGPADHLHRRRRGAGHVVQPVRDRVGRRVPPDVAGMFLQDDWRVNRSADAEPRRALEINRRHERVGRPQPGRL